MEIRGICDIFLFLDFLKSRGIKYYTLHDLGGDTVTLRFTLVGMRVEVDFGHNSWGFSYFKGDEAVLTDFSVLENLFKDNWD